MSERGSHQPTELFSTAHIDQVCDDFEKACRAGRPPMIEEFLLRAPPEQRDRLLADLLEIEIEFRQREHSFVQVEDYTVRFADHAELVESVFRRVVKIRRLADYELLEELGRGGMGVVYKARQVYLNQTVAVKILPHRYLDDPQAVSRFRREMQSIGALSHPNIVRAYNAGEAGGVQFLVMEYVDGINLQRFIDIGPPEGGPVGVGAACEILRQAAAGLQHAHEHQLVHRDIKPGNLIVARDERLSASPDVAARRRNDSAEQLLAMEGRVKLLDMGLAKFHAEKRGGDRRQERLTQPGMTMGTIDYMAPEQWESSATADIRADIYSLGCTLFFLLTGKPPYGEPAYDTSRKKLMAHVVAPIPSLLENCADVPAELQEVFETMMAKEPQDRYATPAEVAEAVAEFADAEELAEVIAALPPHEVCVAEDNTGVHGPAAVTPRQQDAGSGGSHPRRRSRNRWMNRQKFRRHVTVGIAAGVTVVVCGLLAWTIMRSKVERPVADRSPSARRTGFSRNAEHIPPEGGTTSAPASREPLAAELALLPGLNGAWWFDETPWLTPFVRQAIADKVLASPDLSAVLGDRPQGYLDTNTTKAHQWLWQAATRCRGELSASQQKLFDELKAFADDNRAAAKSAVSPLEGPLQEFTAGRGGEWSAADLHTIALLQHAIALHNNDPALAEEARQSYDMALKAYSAPSKGRVSPQWLCLLDSARLSEHLLGDSKEAKRRIEEVLAEKDLPAPLHVSALVARGRLAAETAMSPGEYEDHRFAYAKKVLDGDDAVKPIHPLAAYIAESYAASLLDQWRVEEAGKQFQAAYHIRLTDKEEKDPLAAIYVFQDRQGSAVTNRFRGNLDAARRSFKTLAGEIQSAIDEAERGRGPAAAAFDLPALRAELANCLESWADCELYGGAASGGKVNFSQAADNYDRARKLTTDRCDALTLDCKLAVIRALHGEEKAAAEIAAELRADQRPLVGASQQRAALMRQLAEAVLTLKFGAKTSVAFRSAKERSFRGAKGDDVDGRKLLRTFLDQFKLNVIAHNERRREIVELQLFAAELLLTSDLEDEPKSARKDLKYLDSLFAVFQGRRDMRPYLRRYYELAVEAYGKADPEKIDLVQIAHYLLASRMLQPQTAPGSKATLLLFSFTAKENFAVFLPQDGRPSKRFELTATRDEIKAAKGKPLHLNDELVALVNAEVAAGRPVEVFWNDTASRPAEDPDALTDGDWPFERQLPLEKLNAADRGKKTSK